MKKKILSVIMIFMSMEIILSGCGIGGGQKLLRQHWCEL